MRLPFKIPMISLQQNVIYGSCKTVSSCLEPKGTLNHIPLGNFTSYALGRWRLTLEVGEPSPPSPTLPPTHTHLPPGRHPCAQNTAVPKRPWVFSEWEEKGKTTTRKWPCSSPSRDDLLSVFVPCSHPWHEDTPGLHSHHYVCGLGPWLLNWGFLLFYLNLWAFVKDYAFCRSRSRWTRITLTARKEWSFSLGLTQSWKSKAGIMNVCIS